MEYREPDLLAVPKPRYYAEFKSRGLGNIKAVSESTSNLIPPRRPYPKFHRSDHFPSSRVFGPPCLKNFHWNAALY
jgi:hypothetical protein